ncbi:MAG: hypothetical protein IJX99_03050 [Clostridia bacterium]|nr:hypothetical protein [Clostridia bacterium]
MKKKYLACLIALTIAACFVGGCGKDVEDTTTDNTETINTVESIVETDSEETTPETTLESDVTETVTDETTEVPENTEETNVEETTVEESEVAEPTSEPVVEATPEPEVVETPAPVVESTPEPVVEATPTPETSNNGGLDPNPPKFEDTYIDGVLCVNDTTSATYNIDNAYLHPGITYEIVNGECNILCCAPGGSLWENKYGSSTYVNYKVPSSINGYPVTNIEYFGFYNAEFEGSSITIPGTVRRIEANAFSELYTDVLIFENGVQYVSYDLGGLYDEVKLPSNCECDDELLMGYSAVVATRY